MGFISNDIPLEIITAAGVVAVDISATNGETIGLVKDKISDDYCDFIKATYSYIYTDKCPYTYFSDVIYVDEFCSDSKIIFDVLCDEKRKSLCYNNIVDFKIQLEEHFGVKIQDNKILEATTEVDYKNKLLFKIFDYCKREYPIIYGSQLIAILNGINFIFDYKTKVLMLENAISYLNDKNNLMSSSNLFKRIIITGVSIGGITEKVVEIIEKNKGLVVAFENIIFWDKLDFSFNDKKDCYSYLQEKYFYNQSYCEKRVDRLMDLYNEFKADGIIDISLINCIQGDHIEKIPNPYLKIQTEYSNKDYDDLSELISNFISKL